jgi:hypothetical protein
MKSREILNRNCVAAMRGGEQREEKNQSVTKVNSIRWSRMGEPAREWRSLSGVCRASASGAFPDITAMVGDGMDRRLIEVIRETAAGRDGVHAQESRRATGCGVRASVVARKRVTIVERRDAGKWKRNEPNE